MKDSLARGEAPLRLHLLYTQVLDDDTFADRKLGMEAGFEWAQAAEAVVVYMDLGLSAGMAAELLEPPLIGSLSSTATLRNPVPANLDTILEAAFRH